MEISGIKKNECYTMINISGSWDELRELEKWCYNTTCGKRVNVRSFAFKKESDIMMFKLRWTGQLIDKTGQF